MKRWTPLALLVSLALSAAPAHAKVFKVGLLLAEKHPNSEAEEILSVTSASFVDSRRFDVIERSRLDKIFEERDLQDFIDGSAGDLSNLEGVDMLGLVTYSLEKGFSIDGNPERHYYINIRLTDVKTGRIAGTINSRRATVTYSPTTPYNASQALLENLREAFPPEGIVVSVAGHEVIVDIGVESGIKENDVLEVIREGETLFHPTTGQPLPPVESVIATLKVKEPSNQLSTCKLQKGEEVVVTDRVRLKEKEQRLQNLVQRFWKFKKKN